MRFIEYSVESPFPYEIHKCKTLKEAKRIRAEIRRRRGVKSSIVGLTENGNDYILNVQEMLYNNKSGGNTI